MVVLEAEVGSSCSKSVVVVEAVVVDHQRQLVLEALEVVEEVLGSPTTGGVAIRFPIMALMALHKGKTWQWDYLGRTAGKQAIGLASAEGM